MDMGATVVRPGYAHTAVMVEIDNGPMPDAATAMVINTGKKAVMGVCG